jgi:hypothetical protein
MPFSPYIDEEERNRDEDPVLSYMPDEMVSGAEDSDTSGPKTVDEARDDMATAPQSNDALDDSSGVDTSKAAEPDRPTLQDLQMQLYRDILGRRRPMDDSEYRFKNALAFGGQALGTIASLAAQQNAAHYFGGTQDPAQVAQARASLMQQAQGAGQPIAQLASIPVQQYIQQQQAQMAQQAAQAKQLTAAAALQRAQNAGQPKPGKTYTPEQIEGSRALARSNGVPEEALAGVNPDNVTKVIAEQGKNRRAGESNDIKLQQMKAREEELTRKINDRRTSEGERRDLLQQRLEVQKARLNLQSSTAGARAEADIGQRQVPGVEFEQPIASKTATELTRRKGYTVESMRALNEFAGLVDNIGLRGRLDPTSPEYGRLRSLFATLGPKVIAGEFGNSFTEGHAHAVANMLNDPQGFRGWATMRATAAAARQASSELDHGFRTAVEQAGGRFINQSNPYAAGSPGKTKNYSPEPVRAAQKNAQRVAGTAPIHYTSPDNPAGWDIPPDRVKAFEAAHPEAKPSGG